MIVERHGATVLRVCRAVLDSTDADDAWSETFLAALRAYPRLPADANVEAWLVTIAQRKSIDVLRAASRRAAPVGAVPEIAAHDDHSVGADLTLIEGLAALPTRQKQAVLYHYVAQLPYADVAELLGGSTEAARRAAADGMAKLRRLNTTATSPTGGRP